MSQAKEQRPAILQSIARRRSVWILMALVLFVWLNNSPLFVSRTRSEPCLLAHRGLAQTFDVEGVEWDTNTARIIHEPEHPYLENTIPSMQAAFDYGADIVEFDVRLTKDEKLAVFHDFTVEYRTDGTGDVSDHTLEELQTLDVGYGYTADGGRTYPFRGQGVGMLPSIDEVFEAFPNEAFLVHVKDGGEVSARLLDGYFQQMSPERLSRISLYGDEAAMLFLREKYPTLQVLTKSLLIRAVLQYELVGWTGYVPPAMRALEIHLPLNYARWLWGWPDRFLERMERVNTRMVLVNGNGGASSGFDSEEELQRLPEGYSGCIWTDRIDKIAPYFRDGNVEP